MNSCILCDGAMTPWLFQPLDPKKNIRTSFDSFVRCEECGLGAMAKTPSLEEAADFYALDKYYTQSDGHMPPAEHNFIDRILFKAAHWGDKGERPDIASLKRDLPSGSVALDIGCGGGDRLRQLEAEGYAAYGIEPDPAAASQEMENVYAGNAENIPSPICDMRFDLITITHVIEHCIEPHTAMRNIFSLLKPGGVLWCEAPNCDCVHFQTLTICSEMFDAPRHIYFFGRRSLQKMIEDAGFATEKIYYAGFSRHHAARWRAWERAIYANTLGLDPQSQAVDHTLHTSWRILAKSLFERPDRKYDCIGVIAKKPAA
ncbi:MAG: class I SAM-dependent methyltransferase [Pseudomonadota bacterium]